MSDDSIPRSILILVLILAGGFFAGSETALSCCNHMRMKRKAEEGDRKAKRVVRIIEKFDKMLATLLIGNNVIHVAASATATVLAVSLLGDSGPVVSTVVLTLLVFFFSETIPKNIAKANSDAVSEAISVPVRFLMIVLTPLTLIFSGLGTLLKKAIHVEDNPTMTEDEFQDIVESIEEEGMLEPAESALIQSAVEFSDISAGQIMMPIATVVGIETGESPESIREKLLAEKYSRLPLYRVTPDKVLGVLQAKDLLLCLIHKRELDLTAYMEPPYFIPKEMKLDALFEGFGRRRTHIAFVLDAGGNTVGFVTMEDVMEELVGEIYDEDDVQAPHAPALPRVGKGVAK